MRIEHPYHELAGGQWLPGTLHAHGDKTGGGRAGQAVIDDYAARGYGFVMVAEHDLYTWPGDYAMLEPRGMVLIPGVEFTNGPHLLHVGATRAVTPDPDAQKMIDQASLDGDNGLIVAAHPNWSETFDHIPLAELRRWNGYAGLEVFNGLILRIEGSAYAFDKWDILLSAGKRVWGFADDDSFLPADVQQGWNVAYVRERSVAGVVEALRRGRFYPSTGVVIESVKVEGLTIRLKTQNAQRIVAVGHNGRRLAVADGPETTLEVPSGTRYVRFECWGPGERFAWTQPFFVVE